MRKLIVFLAACLWFSSFARAVIPPHILSQGITLQHMAVGSFLTFATQTVLFFLHQSFRAKRAWMIAIWTSAIFVFGQVRILHPYQFYAVSIISGIGLYYYWIPYNIAYFQNTRGRHLGRNSGIMFSIYPLINIIAPPMAGLIAQYNIPLVWILSLGFFAVSAITLRPLEDFPVRFTIVAALKEIRHTRVLLVLEGIWEAVLFSLIPIYTLTYLKTPLSYASFNGYLALAGASAGLVLGRMTDKRGKRAFLLAPIVGIMAMTTLLFPAANASFLIWMILTGILSLILPIFWNVTTAATIDLHPNLALVIPGRELCLAVGRSIGLFLALLSFLYEPRPMYIYPMLALVLVVYIGYLLWVKNMRKSYYIR